MTGGYQLFFKIIGQYGIVTEHIDCGSRLDRSESQLYH